MRRLLKLPPFLFLLMVPFAYANAAELAAPKGQVILTISGDIEHRNGAQAADFDREMLEQLGMESFETKTPWYEGQVKFEGVRLSKLMKLVGAKGTNVTAVALNDYVTTIPLEDFDKFPVLLALKRNGNYMPVRDKGPLFIIYPFDTFADLRTQTYFGRSAWQLRKLIIE